MKSIALFTEEIDDLEQAVTELKMQCQGFELMAHSAGLLFVHPDADLEDLLALLTEAFDIPIAGVTAAFLFTMEGVKREGISLQLFTADDCTFAVEATGELLPEADFDQGMAKLYQKISHSLIEKPKLLLTYGNPPLKLVGEDFVAALDKLSGGVPLYGGMASDDFAVKNCRVMCKGQVFQYGAAVIAISGNIQPVMSSGFHVDTAIDYTGVVTKVDGSRVLELDGMPFVTALSRAGLVFNWYDACDYLNTPFKVSYETEEGERMEYLRHLVYIDKEIGAGQFFGKVPLGARLQVGVLDVEGIHSSVEKVVQKCLAMVSEHRTAEYHTLLVTSCASRIMSYTNAINDESRTYVDMIPKGMEMSGFYAYGEVCPVKTNENRLRNAFHNTTFSLLVM